MTNVAATLTEGIVRRPTGWDRGRYSETILELCDQVISMQNRGERAEAVVATIIARLTNPGMKGMLDFADSLPMEQRMAGIEEIRGVGILQIRLDDMKRVSAESLVIAAINLCLKARHMFR